MTTPQHIGGLSDEQIELLRSLPQWGGPSVTGVAATAETDELLDRHRLLVGQPSDAPFDGDSEQPARVWRGPAGDALLATIDRLVAAERERAAEGQRQAYDAGFAAGKGLKQ